MATAPDHRLQRGFCLAPFDELADPRVVLDLAVAAELIRRPDAPGVLKSSAPCVAAD